MKITLLGYMASGKSAVGRLLASKLELKFIDLDDYIEEKEGKIISDIFEENGEIYFRRKETEYLIELLSSEDSFVLSLGGGTPCYGKNIEVILSESVSVYLRTNINSLFDRLINETNKRPLVARLKKDELKEFIAKHLFERSPFYEQAQHIIATDEYQTEGVVDKILEAF